MNIIVHIQEGKKAHGYEWGTRQAWACDENEISKVSRVIGVIEGKVVSIIEGVHAGLSSPENNPHHNKDCQARFVFLGGKCWDENDALNPDLPYFMYKKINGLNQGHRYMNNDELIQKVA